MSRWPAMFRMLLCALLLVNAAGTAAATAMHVASGHAQAGTQRPHAVPADACHDAGMDHAPPSAPDCCDDGACTTCTGFAHALPPQPLAAAPGWRASIVTPAPDRGHASVALPRLVRPPIG